MINRLRNAFGKLSFFQIIRGFLFAVAMLDALLALCFIDSSNVKAPFFTLIGGFLFLVVVFPDDIKRVRFRAIGSSLATIVLILGGWFWLETTKTDQQYSLAVGLLAGAFVVFAVLYHIALLINAFRLHQEFNDG